MYAGTFVEMEARYRQRCGVFAVVTGRSPLASRSSFSVRVFVSADLLAS